MKILFDPNAGEGGGGAPDFRSQIPDEFRAEPSLQTITDLPSLVKGYVHAQKLVGQDRVVLPRNDWTSEDWNTFYSKIGRPESPEKYALPQDVQLHESMKFDDAVLANTKKTFHELGLTPKQAEGVMRHYIQATNARVESSLSEQKQSAEKATEILKGEWGEKFDQNLADSKAALAKFGDPALGEYLEASGLGNDVRLIKMLHKISVGMREDNANRGGEGTGGGMTKDQALAEITRLKSGGDEEFSRYINGDRSLGIVRMNELRDKWQKLHSIAFPGVQA